MITSQEFLELKSIMLETQNIVTLLVPSKSTVSYISNITGKGRQTITSYLQNNFEPDVDYWKENGKIYTSKATTLELLRRYNKENS